MLSRLPSMYTVSCEVDSTGILVIAIVILTTMSSLKLSITWRTDVKQDGLYFANDIWK